MPNYPAEVPVGTKVMIPPEVSMWEIFMKVFTASGMEGLSSYLLERLLEVVVLFPNYARCKNCWRTSPVGPVCEDPYRTGLTTVQGMVRSIGHKEGCLTKLTVVAMHAAFGDPGTVLRVKP